MLKQFFSRLTALLCAAALALTLLPLPVAAEGETSTVPAPLVTVDSVSVAQGNSVTVYVRAKNLVNLIGLSLSVEYDPSVLTLTGSGMRDMQGVINTGEAGRVQMMAMAETAVNGSANLMSLTFRASNAAELGTYPLTLSILQAVTSPLTEISVDKTHGSVTITKAAIPQANFSLYGDSTVTAGGELKLQLYSYDLEGMAAGQFSFSYDSTKLKYERISLLHAMDVQDATLAVNSQNAGLAVAAYAAAVSASAGYLMEIVFSALEDVEGTTTVTCQPSSLYSDEKTAIQANSVSRNIAIAPAEEEAVLPKVQLVGGDTLRTDDSISLTVTVEGSSALAAADFVISYDKAVFQCVEVSALPETGDSLNGEMTVFVNPNYDDGKIAFSLFAPDGIIEDLSLVTITLKPVFYAETVTMLTVEVDDPVNAKAESVAVEAETKSLTLTVATFTVTFLDHDGTVLTSGPVAYMTAAEAPEVNGKASDDTVHYVHTGWDADFTAVCEDLEITALYTAEPHAFGSWEAVDERMHIRYCSCGRSETLAHEEATDKAVSETCTETGLTEGKHCSACDMVLVAQKVIPATGHTEVIDDAKEATCTETGLTEGKHCSVCDAVLISQEIVPALGHRVIVEQPVQVDPLTIDNNDSVPFLLADGTYYSNNHTDNASSRLQIIAQLNCTLTLHYGVSSERNYDKLSILHNGIRKAEISGSVTGQTMALTLAAGDVVTVRYSKDVSVSRDQDQGWVTLDYELVTSMGRVEVSVDSLEPDCTGAIVCDDCGTVVKEALGHLDANKDHICDRHCGETNIELHQAAPNGHICEYCGVAITTCADYNNDGLCDTCGSDMGKTYSVIFVVEAGSPAPAVQTVYHGALIGKPIDPVRENYIFAGWTTDAEGNNFWDFGTDRVTEEITLYAQWTRHQWKPAQYVWCANGCTEILSCANCDTTVETPVVFALSGKVFTMSRVPDGLQLLFACYENDGRMVECQMETAAKRIELSIEKNAAEGSCLYVFFLGANWEPLCIQLKY